MSDLKSADAVTAKTSTLSFSLTHTHTHTETEQVVGFMSPAEVRSNVLVSVAALERAHHTAPPLWPQSHIPTYPGERDRGREEESGRVSE